MINSNDLIDWICKKCRYYKRECLYDKGGSETKIPCEALGIIMKMMYDVEGIEHG